MTTPDKQRRAIRAHSGKIPKNIPKGWDAKTFEARRREVRAKRAWRASVEAGRRANNLRVVAEAERAFIADYLGVTIPGLST